MPRDPADLLREHGVQVTAQRLAVLRAVSRRPHCTADDVVRAVRAEISAVGATPCLTAADSGCEIDEAEVVSWGTCPECLAANRGRPAVEHRQSNHSNSDQLTSIKHKENSRGR